ncbi:hypothetical protein Vretimale_358 [Volvox reticuliferus]|uniref:Uncharacterized protein n=1 Tax=Volvox reticuliferus TaxID=1737510 RepID=A0A8J4CA11_9CHLO|nr:hypothetical protein Vretifemale_8153 [Volvox reticuliferus]GIL94026.1 hypothetical protein Vretimale_358 [Volvox reticuliferus]
MRCIKRSWRPKPTFTLFVELLPRGQRQVALLKPLSASRTSTGAPLSLNDVIAFESELPSRVVQELVPERRVDELIDRASRVLREVNSVLTVDDEGADSERRPQGPGPTAANSTSMRPVQGIPASMDTLSGSVSHIGRAAFGGSAQVSEREGTLTRQALQKTLEGSPAQDAGVGGRASSNVAAAVAVTEPQERPAWAQALFSSGASASGSSTPSPSAATSYRPSPEASSRSLGNSVARSSGPMTRHGNPQASAGMTPGDGGWASRAGASSSASASAGSGAPQPQAQLQLQPSPPARRPLAAWSPLAFAEVDLSMPTELLLKSEESMFAEAARSAVLPPLQSVVDLTSAVRPPTRGLDLDLGTGAAAAAQQEQQQAAVSAAVTVSEEEVVQGGALGRRLVDGAGRLADGTRFEKLSGTDTGPDGYVKKWEVLRGVTGDGQVQWEECWWKASNRYGLRELGAFKKGTAESGAAWVEEWKEVLYTHSTNLRLVVERTAHKWARDENADEWEEKWGECFEEAGRVHKWADKWAKAGSNVWHERWGEDYDGKGACQKWTDKWAERLLPDGGQEQWGDKWTETFGHGKGTKHGEVWSCNSGGLRYNRWWNEEHFGDGRARKWGNSTSGEYWDTVEHMDTYYNPVPHFGFQHAVGHSPQLWSVPLPAPDEGQGDDDGLGVGLGRL